MNCNRRPVLLAVVAASLLSVIAACSEKPTPPPASTARTIGVMYPDPRLTEFHKRVLVSMNHSYTVQESAEGTTIVWKPKNEAEEIEVGQRVSQYSIHLKTCGEEGAPKPEAPSQPLGVPIYDICGKKGT